MKRTFIMATLVLLSTVAWSQRVDPEVRKNTVVKQWLTRGTAAPVLDNVTTYDELGRKIEEIEYASYGQKERITYEYEGQSDRCVRRVEYNDKNKPTKVQKIEYNADGTRKKVYNYSPKGNLKSVKTYEYSTR
ncbi:MAG: hypothetical protein IJ620_04880 [Bacteroidales bacterium]|nr:hypothetical protein [Bacteroidales bacterium]